MFQKIVFLIIPFLVGCGAASQNPYLTGAGVGVAASNAAEYVQQAFTPEYKLHALPLEFCFQDGGHYTCLLTPCEERCELTLTPEEWEAQNGKVASLRTSVGLLNSVLEYCKANKAQSDVCIEHLWRYQGVSIEVAR